MWGVTDLPAEKLQFDVQEELTGRKVKTTVVKYFKDRYNLPLRYCSVTHYYKKTVCVKEKDELKSNYELQNLKNSHDMHLMELGQLSSK